MLIINSLRPVKLGSFELRIGDNKFEKADAVPVSVRERLVFFSEVPPQSERGILVFSYRSEDGSESQPTANPWEPARSATEKPEKAEK